LRRARVTQVAPEPRSGLSNTVHSDGDDRLECILGPPVGSIPSGRSEALG
jgi:hypothetical protein